MPRRPEALLERQVLLACGHTPGVALLRNEVGQGFYGAVRPQIDEALRRAGHHAAAEIVAGILMRNRVVYGLGVGSPDLVAIARGHFLGLELKSDEGAVRPEQRAWHAAAERAGARIEVVRSVDDARAAIAEVLGA